MARDTFEVRYEVEDGYVGAGRPQRCHISPDDFEDDMTDEQITNRVYELTHEDMLTKVNAGIETDMAEVIQWVRAHLTSR
jgi:hypothetical protein